MSRFATYGPRGDGTSRAVFAVRAAMLADAAAIAAIWAQRHDASAGETTPLVAGELRSIASGELPNKYVCVAEVEGRVAAYGKHTWIPMSDIAGTVGLPDAWYLCGLVVAPAFRRGGIGRALTEHRLELLSEKTDTVYYFANPSNGATVDLHRALGFEEIARGVVFPPGGSTPSVLFVRRGVGVDTARG